MTAALSGGSLALDPCHMERERSSGASFRRSATSSSLTASICSAVSSLEAVGVTDEQREVGQAVDLARDAVAQVVECFEGVAA